jgi:hypothetical protein
MTVMPDAKLPIAGVLLTAGLCGAVALLPGVRAEDGTRKRDTALIARVDQRVQAWQPTREERRLDAIAWARDLRHALRLARDNSRPVFLFTYGGSAEREHAIALQRC